MNNNNIFQQDGNFIKVLRPSTVAQAIIFSEEQREKIKELLRRNLFPHHTSVGRGHSTRKHWNIEEYQGRFGKGIKMITTSPYSNSLNHITYFIQMI